MYSIRTKFTLLTIIAIIVTMSTATLIGVISIRNLGLSDADQMLHLKCTTGAMNLETYFNSVEKSTKTVAMLVQDSFEGMPYENLNGQVENTRHMFDKVVHNTNGVLTYYFRIDPAISPNVKGFWYVKQAGNTFQEHAVTDISQYDTNDTSALVWFTVPKATGKGLWLPPYNTENLDVRVLSYNVPIYWQQKFVGVIGMEIDYETLAHEVEKIKLFDHGYAFILDADSNVIYHPQMDSTLQYGEKIAIDTPDRILGDSHVQYHFNGIDKEAVFLPLSNGMRLYVTVPLYEINKGWKILIWHILLASIFILVIVSLFTLRLTNNITKPLRNLTAAAKQVANGNYDIALTYKDADEIGILTQTFQQLVKQTKSHIGALHRQVYIDALTSVRNKAGYEAYIQKLQDKMDKPTEKLAFAIGVFDCDNLKQINDTYGHDKGDIYIKTASQLICRAFSHSPVFRIGGDEFAVILENSDFRNRAELFRLFRLYREKILVASKHPWEQANITMGLAVYDAQSDSSVNDVARRADQCMYENKRLRKEKQNKPS
ncbi:hypothetical protein SELR_20780 [Selenomonas ruminantium subsp. lactilytica TAM6421]|uniref:Diguanylate cyclase (GGDEF) domain-containing protein n=1 Tax=Selenomonas ruminantium subsp. lactilytica (strain NBRC 103574 / TAM6421) TaxID=927704 RepID=I0GSP9_SELRL|nr:diguanylate cyclase [Selenomonas ruminantium]BAL83786.1 hypothetical protein SELR_20780 [Selenomonas ruminantium subsp. lactilytica TAM6421]